MKTSQELAITIKEIAKSQNVTIGKMLSDCGLSVNTLSSMQSGGYFPRLEAINKIAEYLNCSVDYLLGREENPNGYSGNNNSFNIGNNSTQTIGNNNNVLTNNDLNEETKEFIRIFNSLQSKKEQTRFMNRLYDLEEEFKKKEV